MSMKHSNSDNRRRAFADVVTIDAWHDTFDGMRSKADLHADVVFGTARVGAERTSPVRFRLSVKRAEIVVVIPESEPVSVDVKSVSREAPRPSGQLTEVLERETQRHAKGEISASIAPSSLQASASIGAGAQATLSTRKKVEISAVIDFMVVTNSKTEEGHYRWVVRPSTGRTLEGRPWDAEKNPRLRIIDERKDPTKSIPPTVRVEVHCRREDLLIEDLEIKDEGIWQAAKSRFGFSNRMAAAVSYIQDQLAGEGLEVKNIEDIFGHVTLASVIAQSV
jgi:hypothetical protein